MFRRKTEASKFIQCIKQRNMLKSCHIKKKRCELTRFEGMMMFARVRADRNLVKPRGDSVN